MFESTSNFTQILFYHLLDYKTLFISELYECTFIYLFSARVDTFNQVSHSASLIFLHIGSVHLFWYISVHCITISRSGICTNNGQATWDTVLSWLLRRFFSLLPGPATPPFFFFFFLRSSSYLRRVSSGTFGASTVLRMDRRPPFFCYFKGLRYLLPRYSSSL